MKTLFASLAIFTLLLQPNSFGQAQGPAQASQILTVAQATTDLQLERTDKDPVYETQQQPDTCYRDVQTGTRQQCDTLYRHDCNTVYQNVCQNVAFPVCQNVPQNICNNIPEQVCRPVNRQVCQNVPRNQCDTVQQCTTVNDSVCQGNPRVCHTVPRRDCKPVTQCHSVPDSVCHNETQQDCHVENRQQCHIENRQQCHDEYRQQCANVPQQVCTDTPYQACQDVPVIVSEAYACTKPVQVQVGETVRSHVIAAVRVVLTNFGQLDVSKEQIVLAVQGKDVSITVGQTSQKVILRVAKKDQQVQTISDIESRIQTTFTLEAISVDSITALSKLKITDAVLGFKKLSFKIGGADLSHLPVALGDGHLNIAVYDSDALYTVTDKDFAAAQAKPVGDHFEIDLAKFDIDSLEQAKHYVNFTIGAKLQLNANELLNPDLLGNVKLKAMNAEFDAFPVN